MPWAAAAVAAVVVAVVTAALLPGAAPAPRVGPDLEAPLAPAASTRPGAAASIRPAEERRRAVWAARALDRWDRARAAAYAAQDPQALAALYTSGSAAGRADVAQLDGYTAAGVRVKGLRMQVLALRVLPSRPGRLRLVVTDRVHHARAIGSDGARTLPADEASTRLVVLRRAPNEPGWRVSAVRPRPGR